MAKHTTIKARLNKGLSLQRLVNIAGELEIDDIERLANLAQWLVSCDTPLFRRFAMKIARQTIEELSMLGSTKHKRRQRDLT